ncbi:MAG: hypothetical protein M1826_002934 [Phylliscum demangeonii]|nr:MAG: hypothetical protein M1826_002934 [Phylliscum demangeonii]
MAPHPPTNAHPAPDRLRLPAEIVGGVVLALSGVAVGSKFQEGRFRNAIAHPPPGSPPPDLEHMFPPGQTSSLVPTWVRHYKVDPELKNAIELDDDLLPKWHAYEYAMTAARARILYAMYKDQWFMECVFHEMGKPIPDWRNPEWQYVDSELFYAGNVCQQLGRRPYGIWFPSMSNYFGQFRDPPQWSEEAVQARVQAHRNARSSPNAFRFVPHQLRALSKGFAHLASEAGRLELAAKRLPLAKVVEMDRKAALALY